MAALDLISLINQVLFVGLFVAVLWRALRQPSRERLDTALLFGAIAGAVLVGRMVEWLDLAGQPWVLGVQLLLLNAAPFAMLRLVDDFRGTPRWMQVAGAAAFGAVAVLGFVTVVPLAVVAVASIAVFLAVGGYAALAFASETRRTRGITRRRMAAVALGAVFFIGAIVAVFLGALVDDLQPTTGLLGQIGALAAVLAFFLGFAPPAWVRQAWREPDLRSFLERSLHVAGVADERAALVGMERAAADAFGATGASIGLANHDGSMLRYPVDDGWTEYPATEFVAGRAFTEQRRVVARDATAADPDHADLYRLSDARTIIAAPISSDGRARGVLAVYASRSPLFIEDDLWLLELLADQAALLLEARTLTEQASELRARENATRLKEEFLSAAAHDLRTPLTVVLGQAELLERRVARDPHAPIDPAGVARMAREARRLRDLVSDLLDAQRLEEARAVMDLRAEDLRGVVDAVLERYAHHGIDLVVRVPDAPLVSLIDPPRLEQVLDNLVDNALKYGAEGAAPEVTLALVGQEARLEVVDRGIGIPEGERDRVFERFFRASNAQSITDTGIGLGLAICRRIVEEHGGRIEYAPTPGGGSTFTVRLPIAAAGWRPTAEVETDAAEYGAPLPLAAEAGADA